MAADQINERSRAFVDESNLRDRILFAADHDSALIRELGILKEAPEPIEVGVPYPTTILVDREGRIQFVDVRRDFHIWLAPELIRDWLAHID